MQIADLLMELALWFESTHLSQIRQHHQTMLDEPVHNSNQLELFDPF